MRQWLGCARLVYNMVVENYRRCKRAIRQYYFRNLLKLKMRWTREWAFMEPVPYEVLDHAISGAIEARDKVIDQNFEAGYEKHRLSFSRKKDPRQTITIRAQYCREPLKFYVGLLHRQLARPDAHPERHKNANLLKFPLHHEHVNHLKKNGWPNPDGKVLMDSKLTYEKHLRQWTFAWVHGRSIRETQADETDSPTVVSIDPGIRTFITWYSSTHGHGHFGKDDIRRIVRLCLYLDALVSLATRVNARRRKKLKKAQARLRQKIKDLVQEVHRKAALWLCQTFDIVVLPIFGSRDMSRRRGRRLRSRTVRQMLTWSHGYFRERLLHKAEEYGVTVITHTGEAYTSKTCTRCGNEKRNLGGRRVFRCDACGLTIDRDLNGARNILLRALLDNGLGLARDHVD